MTLDVPLSLIKEPASWEIEDVCVWLHWLKLPEQVVSQFRAENVDGARLLQINETKAWDRLGVTSRDQKNLLSNAIEPLRRLRQIEDRLEGKEDVVALRAIEGELSGQTFLVGPSGCTGGRHSSSNAIVIRDNYVSRSHFRIVKMAEGNGGFGIQDAGSTTGTFMIMHDRVELTTGMILQLGETEITITNVDASSCSFEINEGAQIINNKEVFTIGRDAGCDLCLADQQISNCHADVRRVDGKFVLSDSWSTNRTWVRLSPDGLQSDVYPIRPGDVFKVGNSLFVVLDGSGVMIDEGVGGGGPCSSDQHQVIPGRRLAAWPSDDTAFHNAHSPSNGQLASSQPLAQQPAPLLYISILVFLILK